MKFADWHNSPHAWLNKTLMTKDDIIREANKKGQIVLHRIDRDSGLMVTDLITAGMPEDEIIV